MENLLFEKIYSKWKEKQLRFQKNRKGRYIHFDYRIDFDKRVSWFLKYFNNAKENIAKHAFYPFIKSDIETPRVKFLLTGDGKKKKPVITSKIRPIAYASHFDSLVYSWYSDVLTNHYQSKLEDWGIQDCVLAYLKKNNQCNIHYASEVFDFIKSKTISEDECVALAFDLSSFFDNLDHDLLKRNWCKVLNAEKLPSDHYKIYKSLTDYTFIQKNYLDIRFPSPLDKHLRNRRICTPFQFREMVEGTQVIEKNPFTNCIKDSKKFGRKCGIPQGSPLSSCLSNIYMIDFDKLINSFAVKKKGLYRRYCDDLIVVCSKQDAFFFENLIARTVKKFEVCINSAKTEKIFFKYSADKIFSSNAKNQHKTLQYLGFEFDGNNVYIRSSSMSRYYRRMSSKTYQAVNDAYDSEFTQGNRVFRKALYEKFTCIGKRNFVKYGLNAQQIMKNSKSIKKQIKNSPQKLEKILSQAKQKKESSLKNNNQKVKHMN
ncbi:MAG: antiviral reverse transcriptase Drt2 [Chitinophagaceae bacterium]